MIPAENKTCGSASLFSFFHLSVVCIMCDLSSVPTEILNSILEHVYLGDLQTLIALQRTSRRLRAVARDVLSRRIHYASLAPPSPGRRSAPEVLNTLLWRNFRPLFTATDCFTPAERNSSIYLTIAGDNLLPFKRLPWARDQRLREAFLRPGASWRDLSIVQPGLEHITHLQVIKSYTTEGADTVEFLRVVLPGGALTMGAFYDILLDKRVHFGDETGEWELLFDMKLRDHDLMQEYECFIREDDDLVVSGPEARHCAILYVQGAITYEEPDQWPVSHSWEPRPLKEKARLLSWDEASKGDI